MVIKLTSQWKQKCITILHSIFVYRIHFKESQYRPRVNHHHICCIKLCVCAYDCYLYTSWIIKYSVLEGKEVHFNQDLYQIYNTVLYFG